MTDRARYLTQSQCTDTMPVSATTTTTTNNNNNNNSSSSSSNNNNNNNNNNNERISSQWPRDIRRVDRGATSLPVYKRVVWIGLDLNPFLSYSWRASVPLWLVREKGITMVVRVSRQCGWLWHQATSVFQTTAKQTERQTDSKSHQ